MNRLHTTYLCIAVSASLIALLPQASLAGDTMSDLYILSVGIEPNLTAKGERDWYAKDAEYIRKAFVGAEPLYETVHSRVLNGINATRSNVLQGLDWLAKKMEKADVAIVFFSGHGGIDADKGYSLSLAHSTEGEPGQDRIWGAEINRAIAKMPGKVIVLIDTCAAGGVVTPTTVNQHNGAFVVACQPRESSSGQWERQDRPHGYFVIAACEALKGLADKNADGIVTFEEFIEYLPTRAKALYPRQNAVVLAREGYESIPLARVDSGYTLQQLWTATIPRNPFGEPDVFDPNGKDVEAFAAMVKLVGDEKDENAKTWNTKTFPGNLNDIEGQWESRWKSSSPPGLWQAGSAQVKSVGKRVYILYRDDAYTYLMDVRCVGEKLLVGRYMNLSLPSDSSPWVGRIVSHERIDGIWDNGRWDLRRKLADNK